MNVYIWKFVFNVTKTPPSKLINSTCSLNQWCLITSVTFVLIVISSSSFCLQLHYSVDNVDGFILYITLCLVYNFSRYHKNLQFFFFSNEYSYIYYNAISILFCCGNTEQLLEINDSFPPPPPKEFMSVLESFRKWA